MEWYCENIHETNVLSPEEYKRLVHLFVSSLTFIPRKVNLENWSLQVCSKRSHLVCGRDNRGGGGGGGVIEFEGTTCLMNITDKILLALKFEFTQKYSASKGQHFLINKKSEVWISLSFFT